MLPILKKHKWQNGGSHEIVFFETDKSLLKAFSSL